MLLSYFYFFFVHFSSFFFFSFLVAAIGALLRLPAGTTLSPLSLDKLHMPIESTLERLSDLVRIGFLCNATPRSAVDADFLLSHVASTRGFHL